MIIIKSIVSVDTIFSDKPLPHKVILLVIDEPVLRETYTIVGDTIGNPFKDTVGFLINTQITVVSLMVLLLSMLFLTCSIIINMSYHINLFRFLINE